MSAEIDPSDRTKGWSRRYTSHSEIASPSFYFERRLEIVRSWGAPICANNTVLNIGCGDGYFAELLINQVAAVHACDISETLLRKTRQRIGQSLRLHTTRLNINQTPFPFHEPFDHVIAVMRSFYQYAENPQRILGELHRLTRRKLIVDFNPRKSAVADVISHLQGAGFRTVCVRAFLVPQRKRLPWLLQRALFAAEETPTLYRVLTRRKFYMWAMAEK